MSQSSTPFRIRDVGYTPGQEWLFPGPLNSITDVPGVQVGTFTLKTGEWDAQNPDKKMARTGVTLICPRPHDSIWHHPVYASVGVLNGTGELSNTHMIKERGFLQTPLALTDTMNVGIVHTGVQKHLYERTPVKDADGRARAPFYLPCVAETSDMLSTPETVFLKPEDVLSAFDDIHEAAKRLNNAPRPPSEFEGGLGGGTGMLCLGHKGGNGTSSRQIPKVESGHYTLGCFVQCNFGAARDLTIGRVQVGRQLAREGFYGPAKQEAENTIPRPTDSIGNEGSILIILGTDAPFVPHQLDRLLRRIPIGLARTGCASHNFSGDIALAFSTQTTIPAPSSGDSTASGLEQSTAPPVAAPTSKKFGPLNIPKASTTKVEVMDDDSMNAFFYAVADVVEEAVLNALCAGKDQIGTGGLEVKGLDCEKVKNMLKGQL
ncbi:peptidase family S58-domain-containing protein [Flagelloscypha sp. PMI_526]|nr:peptidase family S58-domain-containing protein [Flagelloscypha sp. PMI_526]